MGWDCRPYRLTGWLRPPVSRKYVFLRWMGRCGLIGRRWIVFAAAWISRSGGVLARPCQVQTVRRNRLLWDGKKNENWWAGNASHSLSNVTHIQQSIRLSSFCTLGSLEKVTCVFSPILGETNWQALLAHSLHIDSTLHGHKTASVPQCWLYKNRSSTCQHLQQIHPSNGWSIGRTTRSSALPIDPGKSTAPGCPWLWAPGRAARCRVCQRTRPRFVWKRCADSARSRGRKRRPATHGRNRAATIPGGSLPIWYPSWSLQVFSSHQNADVSWLSNIQDGIRKSQKPWNNTPFFSTMMLRLCNETGTGCGPM